MALNNRFMHPFYCFNVALMGSYIPIRSMVDVSPLQSGDMMSFGLTREQQIFACAAIFYLVKLPHMTTNDARLANLFLYFKFVVTAISFMIDIKMFIGYLTIFLLFAIFLKQPEYRGEHNSFLFDDTEKFMDKVCNSSNKRWVIYCYASWADNCISLSPIFAELSLKFGNKYLKFGKIDVGKHAGIANKYDISIKPTTKQLPTLLLIENGKEISRLPEWKDPQYKSKGVKKVPLSVKSIEHHFNLKEMMNKPKMDKSDKKEKKKQIGNRDRKNKNSAPKKVNNIGK